MLWFFLTVHLGAQQMHMTTETLPMTATLPMAKQAVLPDDVEAMACFEPKG